MDLQVHDTKQILITITARNNFGGLVTNGTHTFPMFKTNWWPEEMMLAITKELSDKNVESISLVEVEGVT